jgi:hypothetical protein
MLGTKKRKLPFIMNPAGWGLVGKAKEEAIANWTLEGEALERELLSIEYRYAIKTPAEENDFKIRNLVLDRKYEKITEREFQTSLLKIDYPDETSVEHREGILDIKKHFGEISQRDYDKELATLHDTPWVIIVDSKINVDAEAGTGLEFELDWNPPFIQSLIRNGYTGANESDLVDQWFSETCRSVFMDELDYGPVEESPAVTTQRKKTGGKTEFS